MRRETAYKLAGRKHGSKVTGAGLTKDRVLRFAALPPGQVEQALPSLRHLKGLIVSPGPDACSLQVTYSVLDYSLELLEKALQDAGFHMESSLYNRLVRALVYFSEETQRHNLESPERLIKKSNEVYIKVYDQHPHGDHDETPLELRDYK